LIPRAQITAWRARAPWPSDAQVEQDLILSRALVDMFNKPKLAEGFVFRGGTALHKLFISPAGRYSEDIDLVQAEAGPIGPLLDDVRKAPDPWLGTPRRKQGHGRVTLTYRFDTTFEPVIRMRLKVEINTREHFHVQGIIRRTFTVDSPWFQGTTQLPVYQIEELLGTKLRALYQRKKGRDLYDLWLLLKSTDADPYRIVECFKRYMDHGNVTISRAEFEANLADKLRDDVFLKDLQNLLPASIEYDPRIAATLVMDKLVAKISGDPWRGSGA
jgi:predicted nucleotidyltransferase component of viral defense system